LIDKDGKYITTISIGDILRYIKNSCNFDQKIAETTTLNKIEKYRPYKQLKTNSSLKEVFELSLDQNFIPIVDDRNMFIGIIKRKDILKNIYAKYLDLK
jgi:predicted transcriptional regulator